MPFSSTEDRTSSTTFFAASREVQDRLPGRVRAADHIDLLAFGRRGVGGVRAVVHALVHELAEAGSFEALIRHAGRDEDRARFDLGSVVEAHRAHRAAGFESDDFAGQNHLGLEPFRLPEGSLGEVSPGESVLEPEVVLDAGALPGLSARRAALDDHRLQSLGRAVHRAGETGRTSADDAQVVEGLVGGGVQVESGGELSRRRRAQGIAVGEEHERQLSGGRRVRRLPQRLRLLVVINVEPRVGDVVAGEKRLDLVAAVGPSVADDPNAPFGIGMRTPPRRQQIVEHRVQPIFRGVPRLQQVVMETQVVDRLDRYIGIRVRGQQDELRGRYDRARLAQERGPDHVRHPLVRDDQGNGAFAQHQLMQDLECLGS